MLGDRVPYKIVYAKDRPKLSRRVSGRDQVWANTPGGPVQYCTAGFGLVGPYGQTAMLTAGHCRSATIWGWATPTGSARPVLGEFVCKTGRTTSTTCGRIDMVNQAVNGSGTVVPPAFGFTASSVPQQCIAGDSGGPIWNQYVQAIGIVTGSQGSSCWSSYMTNELPSGWSTRTT